MIDGRPRTIGFSYLFISPLMQFFTYELKYKDQLYYYYNLGLTDFHLWSSTLLVGFLNLIILWMV